MLGSARTVSTGGLPRVAARATRGCRLSVFPTACLHIELVREAALLRPDSRPTPALDLPVSGVECVGVETSPLVDAADDFVAVMVSAINVTSAVILLFLLSLGEDLEEAAAAPFNGDVPILIVPDEIT